MTKLSKKDLRIKLKKYKILHNPSIIINENLTIKPREKKVFT
jgi:hypothetical protein